MVQSNRPDIHSRPMHKDKRSRPVDKHSAPQNDGVDHPALVLVRGGGDLATGVALRLHRAGMKVVITELPEPLAVRRAVSFGEAVYEGVHTVEGITARWVEHDQVYATLAANEIPVLIDPEAEILLSPFFFIVVVDGRLLKLPPPPLPIDIPLYIGLGPGFHAGGNCHAAIETRRSHTLGRVYWDGSTQPDSGKPEGDPRRVLRAPVDGVLAAKAEIGEHVEEGQAVAVIRNQLTVDSDPYRVVSPLKGVLRGLIRAGVYVTKGLKIGDVDPRDDASACYVVSDKALAIGGAALEAILTRKEIREKLW
jgi:xanthine dehydrogenase accessory factor